MAALLVFERTLHEHPPGMSIRLAIFTVFVVLDVIQDSPNDPHAVLGIALRVELVRVPDLQTRFDPL